MGQPVGPPAWPSPRRRFLVVAGLTGFAISQPLLSVLGDDPTTLASHGVEGGSLVLLALAIVVVPLMGLLALVSGVGMVSRQAGRVLYLVVVAALVGCFVVQVARTAGVDRTLALAAVAVTSGATFAIAHIRCPPVGTWAAYTAILPALAMGFFLLASPSSALLSPPSPPEPVTVSGDHPSVVLIILDELPTRSLLDGDDEIDRMRFPHLAALADDATWYRHSSAMAPLTNSAVPTLLTGRLPTPDAALFANHPDNLFTLLGPTHELEVLETVTQLCPYDSCVATTTATDGTQVAVDETTPGFGDLLSLSVDMWFKRLSPGPEVPSALDDFAEDVDPVKERTPVTVTDSDDGFGRFSDVSIAATATRAEAMLDAFDVTKGPSLYYLHLMLPHQPWARQPDGELYDVADVAGVTLAEGDRGSPWSWSDWIATISEQRHLLQAQYADRLIGQLMAGLRDEGLYDDSLVIVTSDHGVSFEPHTSARYVTDSTIDSIAYAPLLVKAPGQRVGVVDDSNLMAFDLLPTIADLLDLPVSWDVDGAAAGSPAIAARGGEKLIYDITGLSQLEVEGILEWEDSDRFPSASDRWIGPLIDPADPLGGLNDRLTTDGVLGARLDDLDLVPGGEAQIDALDSLRRPPADRPPLGLVTGRVPGAPRNAEVVIAINGVVVGGSKLSTDSDGRDGRIAVLLPQGVLGAENDIRAALLFDGEVRELEVGV